MKFSPAAVETTESSAPTLRRSTRKAALEANQKILTPHSSKTRRVARFARATPTGTASVAPSAAPRNPGSAHRPEGRNDDSADASAGGIEPRTPPAGAASSSAASTTPRPRRLFDEPSNASKSSPAGVASNESPFTNLRRSNRKAARRATKLSGTPPRHATPARNAVVPPFQSMFIFGGGNDASDDVSSDGAGARTPPRSSFHREGTPRPEPAATKPDRPATAPRSRSAKTASTSPHRRSSTTNNTTLTKPRKICAVKPGVVAIDERKPLAATPPHRRLQLPSAVIAPGSSFAAADRTPSRPGFIFHPTSAPRRLKYSKRMKSLLNVWKYNWGPIKDNFFTDDENAVVVMFERHDGKMLEVKFACTVYNEMVHGKRVLSRRTYRFPSFRFGGWI